MTRVRIAFAALVLAQAAHSAEEYLGRLWESFPPARFVSGLVADDLERGFLALNVAIVALGLWCLAWPVRRGWPSARAIAWSWAAVEAVNGGAHILWATSRGGYEPGVLTAPVLIAAALALAHALRVAGVRA